MMTKFQRISGGITSLLIMATLLLPAVGCEEQEPDLLSQDLMREVLVELHVADAFTETQSKPLSYRNALREELYQEVLQNFGLDEATFRHTYEYYTSHPDLMDTLYQQVILQLEDQMDGERKARLKEGGPNVLMETPPAEAPTKAPWQNPEAASD